jgi:uncharacterized membrane protein
LSTIQLMNLSRALKNLILGVIEVLTGNIWSLVSFGLLLIVIGLVFVLAPQVSAEDILIPKPKSIIAVGVGLVLLGLYLFVRGLRSKDE